jgi:hypothetical protein
VNSSCATSPRPLPTSNHSLTACSFYSAARSSWRMVAEQSGTRRAAGEPGIAERAGLRRPQPGRLHELHHLLFRPLIVAGDGQVEAAPSTFLSRGDRRVNVGRRHRAALRGSFASSSAALAGGSVHSRIDDRLARQLRGMLTSGLGRARVPERGPRCRPPGPRSYTRGVRPPPISATTAFALSGLRSAGKHLRRSGSWRSSLLFERARHDGQVLLTEPLPGDC